MRGYPNPNPNPNPNPDLGGGGGGGGRVTRVARGEEGLLALEECLLEVGVITR